MRSMFFRFVAFCSLCMFIGVTMPQRASAQDCAIPSTFYRFLVSGSDGGWLLTGYYPEGPANGYSWDGGLVNPGSGWLGIYFHPDNGNVPDPASGLVPLYRWTVIQNGWRTHYYYSTYYTQQPSDRYFNGVAGYVFPPSMQFYHGLGLRPLTIWYSQYYGFWYGYGPLPNDGCCYEQPPNGTFQYQGIIAQLPPAVWDYQFPPSPSTGPPIGSSAWTICFQAPSGGGGGGGGGNGGDCTPSTSDLSACRHLGGFWNYDTCECEY